MLVTHGDARRAPDLTCWLADTNTLFIKVGARLLRLATDSVEMWNTARDDARVLCEAPEPRQADPELAKLLRSADLKPLFATKTYTAWEVVSTPGVFEAIDVAAGTNTSKIASNGVNAVYYLHPISEGEPFRPSSWGEASFRKTGDFAKAERLAPKGGYDIHTALETPGRYTCPGRELWVDPDGCAAIKYVGGSKWVPVSPSALAGLVFTKV